MEKVMETKDKDTANKEELESSDNEDEVLKISEKFYKKISDSMNKTGFADGLADGQQSIFQKSFDKGYEDGFRNGFLMGKLKSQAKEIDENFKPATGNCQICVDQKLLEKSESELQDIHGKINEDLQSKHGQ